MACIQSSPNVRRSRRLAQVQEGWKQPQGVKKQGTTRTSPRLQAIQRLREQAVPQLRPRERTQAISYPSNETILTNKEALGGSSVLLTGTGPQGKRKRPHNADDPHSQSLEGPVQKHQRTLFAPSAVDDTPNQTTQSDFNNLNHPIDYWVLESGWPKEYFEQDNQLRKHLQQKSSFEEVKHEDWFKEQFEEFRHVDAFKEEYGQMSNISHLLAKQKSSSSLHHKNSASSIATSSDPQPREAKSAKYSTANYRILLETKDSFMRRSELDVTDASKDLCRILLGTRQIVPQDTLFRDDIFRETCENVEDRNEAMVVRDINPLICPSAQILKIKYNARHLTVLEESVNEGWNSAIPFQGPRPQPDYSVGFARSAFTDEQLERVKPFVGEVANSYTSYFMGTWRMYFPFLTCEVKCGAMALDVADRQNAHSMTLAVRGIVELYKAVKRQLELHREILAFSISHDDSAVRIYGHYAIIEGDKTCFYRHPIKKFDFTSEEGRDKWAAYQFTKNVYDIWMPIQLKRICSVIDELPPGINFGLSQSTSLPQELELHNYQISNAESTSLLEESNRQSNLGASQDVTPNTAVSQRTEPQFKKPKNNSA